MATTPAMAPTVAIRAKVRAPTNRIRRDRSSPIRNPTAAAARMRNTTSKSDIAGLRLQGGRDEGGQEDQVRLVRHGVRRDDARRHVGGLPAGVAAEHPGG